MLQDDASVGWDPLVIPPHLSAPVRIYVLFLLVTVIATMVRLISLWIAAPPFWLSRQANNPDYLYRLRTECAKNKQWMIGTLLGWGVVTSIELFHATTRLLEVKLVGTSPILFAIRDFASLAEAASMVALFLFLVQWHLMNRIERLPTYSPSSL